MSTCLSNVSQPFDVSVHVWVCVCVCVGTMNMRMICFLSATTLMGSSPCLAFLHLSTPFIFLLLFLFFFVWICFILCIALVRIMWRKVHEYSIRFLRLSFFLFIYFCYLNGDDNERHSMNEYIQHFGFACHHHNHHQQRTCRMWLLIEVTDYRIECDNNKMN